MTTAFLCTGQNLIAQTTGGAISEFLFAPGIDKPLAAYTGGTAYYYSVDGLGSVSLLSNAAGTVQDSYTYDVWGRTLSQTVNVPQPFVYTAREAGERGLLYYRARYFDPSIGRFISEDPVRYADFSLYPYVGNDPVKFIDPSGLAPVGSAVVRNNPNDPLRWDVSLVITDPTPDAKNGGISGDETLAVAGDDGKGNHPHEALVNSKDDPYKDWVVKKIIPPVETQEAEELRMRLEGIKDKKWAHEGYQCFNMVDDLTHKRYWDTEDARPRDWKWWLDQTNWESDTIWWLPDLGKP